MKIIMKIHSKFKETLFPIFIFIFIFLFISFYTLSENIDGDGANNAVLAKEIIKSQNLLQHQPYRIAEITSKEITYYPIPYSQFSHVLIAILYLFMRETGFKLFSPFLAMGTAFFVYVLLRGISPVIAVLSCILITIIGSLRFISATPLMEQYLLPIAVASICFYSLFSNTKKKQYLALTGLFLAISFVTKQQGILFAGGMLFIIFLNHLYSSIRLKRILDLKRFTTILLTFIGSSIIPSLEQIGRNGTIDFVPSTSVRIPFLYPKYFINQEAFDAVTKWLGSTYWFTYDSLFCAFKTYMLYPMFYTKAPSTLNVNWLIILSLLVLLGIFFAIKKNKKIGIILFSIFLLEILSLYFTNTPIQNYHVIGLAILGIFLSTGTYYLCKLIPNKKN